MKYLKSVIFALGVICPGMAFSHAVAPIPGLQINVQPNGVIWATWNGPLVDTFSGECKNLNGIVQSQATNPVECAAIDGLWRVFSPHTFGLRASIYEGRSGPGACTTGNSGWPSLITESHGTNWVAVVDGEVAGAISKVPMPSRVGLPVPETADANGLGPHRSYVHFFYDVGDHQHDGSGAGCFVLARKFSDASYVVVSGRAGPVYTNTYPPSQFGTSVTVLGAVEVSPVSLEVGEGNSASVSLRLTAQPAGTVVVTPSSSDQTVFNSFSPASLSWSGTDYLDWKQIAATALSDDDQNDESVEWSWEVTGYGTVQGSDVARVLVTVRDDDVIQRVSVSASQILLREGEACGRVLYRLTTQPVGNVTVSFSSADSTAATIGATVAGVAGTAELSFSNTNWAAWRQLFVCAPEDDDLTDESIVISGTVTGYGSSTVPQVIANICDNDARCKDADAGGGGITQDETEQAVRDALNQFGGSFFGVAPGVDQTNVNADLGVIDRVEGRNNPRTVAAGSNRRPLSSLLNGLCGSLGIFGEPAITEPDENTGCSEFCDSFSPPGCTLCIDPQFSPNVIPECPEGVDCEGTFPWQLCPVPVEGDDDCNGTPDDVEQGGQRILGGLGIAKLIPIVIKHMGVTIKQLKEMIDQGCHLKSQVAGLGQIGDRLACVADTVGIDVQSVWSGTDGSCSIPAHQTETDCLGGAGTWTAGSAAGGAVGIADLLRTSIAGGQVSECVTSGIDQLSVDTVTAQQADILAEKAEFDRVFGDRVLPELDESSDGGDSVTESEIGVAGSNVEHWDYAEGDGTGASEWVETVAAQMDVAPKWTLDVAEMPDDPVIASCIEGYFGDPPPADIETFSDAQAAIGYEFRIEFERSEMGRFMCSLATIPQSVEGTHCLGRAENFEVGGSGMPAVSLPAQWCYAGAGAPDWAAGVNVVIQAFFLLVAGMLVFWMWIPGR